MPSKCALSVKWAGTCHSFWQVNTFQRKFVNDVRRCDEMQRVLRFVEEEIKKEGIQVLPEDSIVDTPLPKDMIDMEVLYQKMEAELSQVEFR